MPTTKTSPATDSSADLRKLVGDDATAEFEEDPSFVQSDPTASASSENLALQRDTDDTEESDEEIEDEEDDDDDDDELEDDEEDEDDDLEDDEEDDEELEDDEEDEDEDLEDDEDEVGRSTETLRCAATHRA